MAQDVTVEAGDDLPGDGGTDGPPAPLRAGHAHGRPRRSLAGTAGRFWEANRRGLLIGVLGTAVLRLVTEWIGLDAAEGIGFPHAVARQPSLLTGVWGRWDAGYYLSIARYGYAGRVVGPGQTPKALAFGPAYPWAVRLVHLVTPLSWIASAELASALALVVAVAALHRLASWSGGDGVPGAAVVLLLAFPTSFFLLAPYPESTALALVALALVAARSERWLSAGVLAAAACLTKDYLLIVAAALCVEAWRAGRDGDRGQARRLPGGPGPYLRIVVPPVVAFGGWMVYLRVHTGDALAFAHAQSRYWDRHVGSPVTLAWRTAGDLVHLRFLDTSTASVTELFDSVTVVLLAAVAVYVFVRVRRSYGVLLGLGWCVFTFQTYLLSVTREVLVLAPFFLGLGVWTARRRWLERLLLALFLPCAYFLVVRYVTRAYAG